MGIIHKLFFSMGSAVVFFLIFGEIRAIVIENIAVLSKKSDKISKFVGRDFSIFSSKSTILQFPNFTVSTFPE